MKVVPIVLPNILWNEFVSETKASLGRSPTRSLDEARCVVGGLGSFIQALGEFQREGTDPIPYLRSRENDPALDMMSFTFLIEGSRTDLYDVLKIGHISTLPSDSKNPFEDTILASGTLRQWRLLLEESVTGRTVNPVVIEIAKCLIRLGLRDLISGLDFRPKG